ncbi:MAG: hypothetical protein DMF47_02175 [Verrucomicrobia bacterium]|nr:MAG: hypothetical protein DMF47_02175 [Verrucomicrobiota bacterium]PYL86160.1 MAG: hypothetical protein DMF17_06575 [Verrucomicrobiota bacterium]
MMPTFSPPIHRGWPRARCKNRAEQSQERVCGRFRRSFVPVDSESFHELTGAFCFDTLAL